MKVAAKAGAIVDEASQIVKISVELLRELLSKVLQSYIVGGTEVNIILMEVISILERLLKILG
ncbi:MAG TPA: hypothetical protein GX527_05970 [Clostridiaceae bacterium]|jgi:trimethylamine:corrinoid methyltransferase-like protein|nr:hypothetical protein [Clostridiaceae bacterium]